MNAVECQALNNQIVSDPRAFFNTESNKSALRIFETLYQFSKKYKSLYMSQSWLAKQAGYCRQIVNEKTTLLHEHGFIRKVKRTGKRTCEYVINDYYLTHSGRKILRSIFSVFIAFELISLSSKPAADHETTQLILTKVIKTTPDTARRANYPSPLLWLSDDTWLYGTESGVPNKKTTYEEFEAIIHEKEQYMYNFTAEQLEQLTHYPKESVTYATKTLTTDLHTGKEITNQFAYLLSIVKRHAEKTKQTPQTGQSQTFNKQPLILRTADNFKPGMPVINPPGCRQAEVKTVETNLEFACNVERILHNKREYLKKGTYMTQNPLWQVLTDQEKQIVMAVHVDCNCRPDMDYLRPGIVQPPIQKDTIVKEVVTHGKNSHQPIDNKEQATEEPYYDGSNLFEEVF